MTMNGSPSNERRTQAIISSLPGAFFHYNGNMQLVDWNRLFEEATGAEGAVLQQSDPLDFVYEDDRLWVERAIKQARKTGVAMGQARLTGSNGDPVPYYFSTTRVEDETGTGLVGIAVNISDLKDVQRKLRRESAFLQAVLDSADEGFIVYDNDDRVIFHNRTYLQYWNVTSGFLEHTGIEERNQHFADSTTDPEAYLRIIGRLRAWPDEQVAFECELLGQRTLDCTTAPVVSREGERLGRIWTFRDITRRKIAEAQSHYYATHDDVTGLLNRDALMAEMAKLRALGDVHFGVISVSIIRFKQLVSTFGHAFADRLLHEIGQRLEATLSGEAVLGKSGGEEFIALIPGTSDVNLLTATSERLLEAIRTITKFERRHVFLDAKAGLSISPVHGEAPAELLLNAGLAKTFAQEHHSTSLQVYTGAIGAEIDYRISMERNLRESLESDQFYLKYQPIYSMETGTIVACEALVRWESSEYGPLSPNEFIPVAENAGLIVPLGTWVLREACREAVTWPRAHGEPVAVSVNVSTSQVLRPNFVETVTAVLNETGLPPHLLELELTESVIAENHSIISQTFNELRALGVVIALDDFGTGYSSLSYLNQFNFQVLKIDRAFVKNLGASTADNAILESIVTVADTLGYIAVAEGVERPEQLKLLRSFGCRRVQGYLFHRPQRPAEIVTILTQEPPLSV